jgi:hypothetical protein
VSRSVATLHWRNLDGAGLVRIRNQSAETDVAEGRDGTHTPPTC